MLDNCCISYFRILVFNLFEDVSDRLLLAKTSKLVSETSPRNCSNKDSASKIRVHIKISDFCF